MDTPARGNWFIDKCVTSVLNTMHLVFTVTFLLSFTNLMWAIIAPGSCQAPKLPPASRQLIKNHSVWHLDHLLPTSSGDENPLFRALDPNQNQVLYMNYPRMHISEKFGVDCWYLVGNMTTSDEAESEEHEIQFHYKAQFTIGIGDEWAHGCFKYHVYVANIKLFYINETLIAWMCTETFQSHDLVIMVLSLLNSKSTTMEIFSHKGFPKVSRERIITFTKTWYKNTTCSIFQCPKGPNEMFKDCILIGLGLMCGFWVLAGVRYFYRF